MNFQASSISLNDLKLYGYHGVSKQEQAVGCWYQIGLTIDVQISAEAWENDQLEGTVNYAEVYDTIKREFLKPSELLENVAWRIAKALFSKFTKIKQINLSIEKLNPPMGADVKSTSIRIIAKP